SIVCPANANGVVGIKPTVGLVSRAGVIPISHTQDTVGPHARTVADAATVLTAIVQRTPDPRDPATGTSPLGMLGQPRPALPADYRAFLNPKGLRGARIGVVRDFEGFSPHADAIFDSAVTAIGSAGATLVDPVSFPHLADINSGLAEFTVLLFDFKIDIANYLRTRIGVPVASHPVINEPAGLAFGVPVGVSFIRTAFSEPSLSKLASGFEAVTRARQKPQFLQTLPFSRPSAFKVRGRGLLPKRNTPPVSEL